MLSKFCSHRARLCVLGLLAVSWMLAGSLRAAQTFFHETGTHSWNEPSNWTPPGIPDGVGTAVVLPARDLAPYDDLTVTLDSPVTIGSITIHKPTGPGAAGATTISGLATLTLDNGVSDATLSNEFSTEAGPTLIGVPLVLNSTFTVNQSSNNPLEFGQSLSGDGGLNLNRTGAASAGTSRNVVLGGANSYQGSTVLTGANAMNYLLVRLDDPNSIPGGIGTTGGTSHLTINNSVIIGLGASDFTRPHRGNNDPHEFRIEGSGNYQMGWAAFGEDRAVNIFGDGRRVIWGDAAGTDEGLNLANALVLGHETSDRTIDFQNMLDLTTGEGSTASRIIRVLDGAAAVDAVISGPIVSTGVNSAGRLDKQGNGTLSLTAANTYPGSTTIGGGVLRLDHAEALPAQSGLRIMSGGVLGLGEGNDEFARDLGTVGTTTGVLGPIVELAGNSGFAAYGGTRVVRLNDGAELTWGSGSFAPNNLLLSDGDADGTLDFQNPINLGSQNRLFVTRNGSAQVDARLSGVISGTGSFQKNNPGTLELSAANTYQGATTITSGVLLLTNAESIPGGITGGNTANIAIQSVNANNIGTIGLGHGDFTTPVGFGPGQINLGAHAAFAAFFADRAVNLGGASQQVTWGSGGFVTERLALAANDSDATVDFQNPINLAGGAREVQVRNGSTPIDGVLSGVISGSGSLEKLGGGTLSLTGANTYDGGTLVTAGRLLVNNTSGSGVGTGDVTLDGSVSLGGTGSIGTSSNPVNVIIDHGTIRPGDALSQAPGELTVVGHVSITGAPGLGFLHTDLGDGVHGKLTIDGTASIAGTLNVSLVDGFTPTPGATFEILTATGGYTGTFSALNFTFAASGWQIAYNPNSIVLTAGAVGLPGDLNGDGVVDARDYVWWRANDAGNTAAYNEWRANFGSGAGSGAGSDALAAVPEPSTLILLALVAPLVALRRKRGTTNHDHSA